MLRSETLIKNRVGLLLVIALVVLASTAIATFLPPFVITLLVGLIGFAGAYLYPSVGLFLIFASLYFPLLPNVELGPLEFSASTLPVVGLAASILVRKSKPAEGPSLARWQKSLLILLAGGFLLAVLFSTDFEASVTSAPNLILYLIVLFGIIKYLDTPGKLYSAVKIILVLSFLLSIWRIELRPLRGLLGLSSLGVNGMAYSFHPGVGISFMLLLLPVSKDFSRRWKVFAALTLVSLLVHGFLLQTRAAWVAWGVILLVVLTAISPRRWIRFTPILAGAGLIIFLLANDLVMANVQQTLATITAVEDDDYTEMSPDDRIRIYARDAGIKMFEERPLLGWGPNTYNLLKPSFVEWNSGKEANISGAFNSWLLALAETGLVGTIPQVLITVVPVGITWYSYRKRPGQLTGIAFGFALGMLGLAVHQLFIGLMFSFWWLQVGFACAAARMALANDESGAVHAAH